MQKFLLSSLFLVLLLSAAESWALPPCPSSYGKNTWDNCQGTYTYSDGAEYVGEWNDGKKHGQGTYTWRSGDKYVGEFKDNVRTGQGTVTWANGDKYVGEFKDGEKHGQGTLTRADGSVKEGIWKDGVYLAATRAKAYRKQKRAAAERAEAYRKQNRMAAERAERERKRIAKEKKEKYDRIYRACVLDESDGRDMQAPMVQRAVRETCRDIAKDPSWLESFKYDK